jgi:hypothetical protein
MLNTEKKLIMLSFVACLSLANQTVNDAITYTLTSGGDENITITDNGSITTDDIDINIINTLQSGLIIENNGTLTSNDDTGIYLAKDNYGVITNNRNIFAEESGIDVENNNAGVITNNGTIGVSYYGIDINTNSGYITNNSWISSSEANGMLIGNNTGFIQNEAGATILSKYASIAIMENNGTVANNGTLVSTESSGIAVYRDNTGTILNDTDGDIDSNQSAIIIYGSNSADIINKGKLTSTDANGLEIDADNNGTILNEGNITAANYGIKIKGTNNKTVQNSGNINGESEGIYLATNSNTGLLINDTNAAITGHFIAVDLGENKGTIINNGTLITNSEYDTIGDGIWINNDNEGNITNNGSIIAQAAGIIVNSDNKGYITNNGTIDVNTTGVFISNNLNSITNNGTIKSGYRGVFIDAYNKGTILNDTEGNITSDNNAVYVNINLGTITNKGTMTSANDYAIKVEENNASVINYGTIDHGSGGIFVTDNNKDVINEGTITANIGIGTENNYANITNNNLISSFIGITTDTNENNITNNGLITSNTGIAVSTNEGNILNSSEGNITSQDNSIDVSGNLGYITNNGYLSGTNAINVGDNNGTVINNATISQSEKAINVETNNNTVLNSGVLENINDTGIYVYTNNATVTNQGKIESDTGIVVQDNTDRGLILNDTNAAIYSQETSIFIGKNSGSVINNGILNSNSDYGDSIDVSFYNEGNIINNGSINTQASGISIGQDNTGNITNNGSINVNYSGIYAFANEGNITNNGTIQSENFNGIFVYGDNEGTILNNTDGNITAKNAAIAVWGSETGTVINNGTLIGKYAFQTQYATSGTFTNNGTAEGSIDAQGIDVINNGTVKLSTTDNIEAKTYIQSSTGILDIGVYTNKDTSSEQTLYVQTAGNITFENGSTIKINFVNTTDESIGEWFASLSNSNINGYKDFNNPELIAQTTDGNITADIQNLDFQDNSALLSFSAENNGTVMTLIVKKDDKGLENLVNTSTDIYALGVAKALDTIFNKSEINADIDRFLTVLDSKSSNEDKLKILDETTPVNTLVTSSEALRANTAVNSIISTRQRGLNSGDIVFKDRNLWIKPYYTYTTQSDKDGYKGFSAHTHGFVLGIDGEYTDSKRFGLALAYSKSDVDTNDLPQSSDIDGYTFIMYGVSPVVKYQAQLSYQVGIGVQKVNTDRYISAADQKAYGSYNAKLFYLQAVINKNMQIKDQLTFIPKIKFAYKYYNTPSYSETGAGGLNLNIAGYTTKEMLLGTGGLFSYKLNLSTDFEAYANIDYNFQNDRQTVSASFQGASDVVFNTDGIKNSAVTYNGGISINKNFKNNISLSIGVNIDRKTSGFTSRSIFAKYNIKF